MPGDACLELANALPVALKSASPGTVVFRRALRDARTKSLEVSNGAVNIEQDRPSRLGRAARVMVRIQNGKWVLQP